MHDGMPYDRNQGQGHSSEVDRQSPTGLIFVYVLSPAPTRYIILPVLLWRDIAYLC